MFDRRERLAGAWTAAFACHATLFVVLATLSRHALPAASEAAQHVVDRQMVWLNTPGPGGGGGGGGNRRPEPARRLERPGADSLSVPAPPPTANLSSSREPDPIDRVIVPVKPLGDAVASLPGLIDAPSSETISQGTGTGPGAGTGRGTGLGPGDGPGLDAGRGGGFGGDVYQPGGDVTMPVAIHVERPRYSNDAMRARIQGIVVVGCVVRPNGVCSDIHVTHSLDPRFGLDDEAVRAAALWRFRPGTRRGQPVSVAVRIELAFTVR